MKDYQKLKELLEEQEQFPVQFTYKFIGRNSSRFLDSVKKLEQQFPALKHEGQRLSANQAHSSQTYSYNAPSAQAIIDVFQAIEKLDDILMVL